MLVFLQKDLNDTNRIWIEIVPAASQKESEFVSGR